MNVAIITGASSGMGKEFVLQADKRYALDEIWVIARRVDRLNELQSLTKTKIVPVPLDLTLNESFNELNEKLSANRPNVKLLINASGFGKFGEAESSNDESNVSMCDLNLKALIRITLLVLPYISKGGKIIELGSLSSFEPVPHLAVYAATKAGVLSFSRALNFELKKAKRGIKVLCVCPYWVKTEFFSRANEKESIEKFDILYDASFVVKKAYDTIDKTNKDYVVPGKYAKLIRFLAKFLSHKTIMKLTDRQFKYKKTEK